MLALGSSTRFDCAREERKLSFPRDHAKQGDFQSEWWHLVGRLQSGDGHMWGYQLTIFRHRPMLSIGNLLSMTSPWSGYAGHLAITNIDKGVFVFFETRGSDLFNSVRVGNGDGRLEIAVNGWRLFQKENRFLIEAREDNCGIDLELVPNKTPVLHGKNGYSKKLEAEAGASYHYSITSMNTQGRVTWNGRPKSVVGESWLDREFGSRMFSRNIRGWDWFGLILDNDLELMIILFRTVDEPCLVKGYGTLVLADGACRVLENDEIKIESKASWSSPNSGALYPMGWSISLPSSPAKLDVTPMIEDHELVTRPCWRIDYWEGPVTVSGEMFSREVLGRGYVEMTGYHRPIGGKF
jgi:predicted secreted hydrolase